MTDDDEKNQRILAAALEVFARHGFRKTAMQDIADAAGMSRAALYLRFRNKEDLFRSGAAAVHAQVLQRARTAFAANAPFGERLRQVLLACTEGFLEPLDRAGHGQELFTASMDLAADINADHRRDLLDLIRDQLARAAERGEIALPAGHEATQLADLIHTTATAFKHEGDGLPALRQRVDLFATMLSAALAPRAVSGKSVRRPRHA